MEILQYIVLFIIIIVGIIMYYSNSIDKSGDELQHINLKNECPKCFIQITEDTFEIDRKKASCDGISTTRFNCKKCGYENSFHLKGEANCSI